MQHGILDRRIEWCVHHLCHMTGSDHVRVIIGLRLEVSFVTVCMSLFRLYGGLSVGYT